MRIALPLSIKGIIPPYRNIILLNRLCIVGDLYNVPDSMDKYKKNGNGAKR